MELCLEKKLEGGHATIIEKIKDDVVTLIYPEDEAGYRDVNLKTLLTIETKGYKVMSKY